MMATLQSQMLGEFRLVYGETSLHTINTPRLQALLAYLLLHRDAPQARRQLAFLFWPDSSEKQARTNLRHQFHLLREALPDVDSLLQADGQMLAWRSDAVVRLDVTEFESAARQNHSIMALQEAIDLYQGDLLPNCYDDWVLPLRERLRQTFVAALERLIGLLEQEHDYATAIRYAQRLRQFDPLHEATYRHLMRLYALQGDHAGVQRTYEECVRCLQRELDTPPTAATSHAYEHLVKINTPLLLRHNLAVPLTALIGRTEELAQVATLLADPACRLLTVGGAGGMGKSRLALQVAWGQIGQHLHGVYAVALHSIASPDFLVSTIADALGFSFHGAQDPKVQLLNYLHEKEMLLLLDNFEHLLEGAGLLVEILTRAPAVKLMVTSRQRLKLAGEWLYEIHGLAVPDYAEGAQIEEVAAVQLFTQHAQRVQVGFPLDQATKPAVARICQLVEGMPLALELAAAWVRLLACDEIVQELMQSLDLLSTSSPTGLERHHSIRAVFDHSWNLLMPEEQQVFRRLAVFQGGFRREAAKQVAGASLPLLAALVDKSLLRWNRLGRYEMHELIRQYASEKLVEAGEKDTIQHRHGIHYLDLVTVAESELHKLQAQLWFDRLGHDHDNIRTALSYSLHTNPEMASRLTAALGEFWFQHGHYDEGRSWLEQALRQSAPVPSSIRAKALQCAGRLAGVLGHYYQATVRLEESLISFKQLENWLGVVDSLNYLGVREMLQNNLNRARSLFEEALSLCREESNQRAYATTIGHLGMVALYQGHYERAKGLLTEGLTVCYIVKDSNLVEYLTSNLGYVELYLGCPRTAITHFIESLTMGLQQHNPEAITWGLEGIAEAYCQCGKGPALIQKAARLLGAADKLRNYFNTPLPPIDRTYYDRSLSMIRLQFDETAFAKFWAEGAAMSLEQAVAYALADHSTLQ